jgi:hypothetical protein
LFLNGYVDKNAATLILCLRVKRTPRLTDLNSASVSNERGLPRPARAGSNLVGRGIAKPYPQLLQQQQSFEQYLKAQKRRNPRQIICYAKRYHNILQTGDASVLAALSSGAIRRHAMEALTVLSKYQGCYDRWCQIRKCYSLRWTNGDESLRSFQRFFNPEDSLDKLIARVNEMVHKLPAFMGQIIKFGVLTGLRASEAIESVRLLNSGNDGCQYYDKERQTLEHFRFPDVFLRRTKKAYISFITREQLSAIGILGCKNPIPTLGAITKTCYRRNIRMDMYLTRKIFASWLRKDGIQPEVVDLLQGRVSPSVLTRHYLTPSHDLKDKVLDSLDRLHQQIAINQ